jgi:hypothetical protein
MALSEHEQRLLDEMERGFYQSEADLMQAVPSVRRVVNYRSIVLGVIVVLLGIGVLLGAVAAQQLWLGLIGFAAMLGGVVLMLARGPAGNEAAPSETESSAAGRGKTSRNRESLSERAERRWQERMGDDR